MTPRPDRCCGAGGHTPRGVLSIDFLLIDDRPALVSGGHDGAVRCWDAETGEQVREFLGHSWSVWGVAAGCLDGSPVVVSGSRGQDRPGLEYRHRRVHKNPGGIYRTDMGRRVWRARRRSGSGCGQHGPDGLAVGPALRGAVAPFHRAFARRPLRQIHAGQGRASDFRLRSRRYGAHLGSRLRRDALTGSRGTATASGGSRRALSTTASSLQPPVTT
jgi:hypothetical protein